jgi:hypothetical protein
VFVGADGFWLSAFADGSTRRITDKVSAKTVLHLFQMNDGNPIDYKELQ